MLRLQTPIQFVLDRHLGDTVLFTGFDEGAIHDRDDVQRSNA